ncbi:hypothetical protein BDB00DRAFT_450183 [Zychaea mexicana]|uniref:uncharacterized protein n=1 Tax=Zychaea mexicana TaxID=64656 RepID=UPI0022FE280C|nr:uncharacterized protein BDB00DRAFT_450183 [Zychaea mexicana]KAI9498474.1 hypothetical protein BDB00DRAFT_450183 [Zychaea mexicana]
MFHSHSSSNNSDNYNNHNRNNDNNNNNNNNHQSLVHRAYDRSTSLLASRLEQHSSPSSSTRHRSRSPGRSRRTSPPLSQTSSFVPSRSNNRQYSRHDDSDHHHNHQHHQHDRRERTTQPNINVVLRSLPDRAQERDIYKTLENMTASVDEVTLIRDRDTGESRKFAFVRFTSVGHAVQFVEKHYPHFYMGHHRVRVDYCNKEGAKEDKIEWRCLKCGKFNNDSRPVCVECRAPFEGSKAQKRSKEIESMAINDGTKDVAHTSNNMILLRNLDNLSSEESIFYAVRSLPSLRRVLLIKDKLTRMSCGFAFVEFTSAQAAIDAMTTTLEKDGFKVDGCSPRVSYASPDSFLPAYASSEWAIAADVEDGLWIYRDGQAYAAECSVDVELERVEKRAEEKRMAEERKAREEEEKKERAKR